jgi:hypothetical protein
MQWPTAKGTVHDESERSARSTATKGVDVSLEKMRQAGMPDIALKTFACYYEQLRNADQRKQSLRVGLATHEPPVLADPRVE